MNKRKVNRWKDMRIYLLAILTILIVGLIGQLLFLRILPVKITVVISSILVIIWLLMYLLQYNRRVNKYNRALGKLMIILLSGTLAFANIYVFQAGDTLRKISGATIKTDAISVIVLNDSSAKVLEDVKGKQFGIQSVTDRLNTDAAIQDIKGKLNQELKIKEYKTYDELAKALYSKQVEVIIMNEAYKAALEETYPNFQTETRVIYQYTIETQLADLSKNVNVAKDAFNIFISGIDTYGPISTSSRSDVNMVATVNPASKQILLTSIPRDYYVKLSCLNGAYDKLTHAGIYGVDCSVGTIENLFGIDINYYARVNFSSLINIVDALGGIYVESPKAFTSNDGYSFSAGRNYLNGKEALAFSRDRYHQEGGDRGRGKNQMRVIEGIISKAISPSIITNYSSLMSALSGSFQTNLESREITDIIKMQLQDMTGWTIIQNSVDGTGGTDFAYSLGNNAYVMYPDTSTVEKTKQLIQKVQKGETISNS